jgi:hypothetical protein
MYCAACLLACEYARLSALRWSTTMEKVKQGVRVDGPWTVETKHEYLDQGTKGLEDGPRMAST